MNNVDHPLSLEATSHARLRTFNPPTTMTPTVVRPAPKQPPPRFGYFWATPQTVVDVGGGTGIVSQSATRAPHRNVFLADVSPGMLSQAYRRMSGRTVRASRTALPFRGESMEAVVCVWFLHLLPTEAVRTVIAEAVRAAAGRRSVHHDGRQGSRPRRRFRYRRTDRGPSLTADRCLARHLRLHARCGDDPS